jgi:hypothetical protein
MASARDVTLAHTCIVFPNVPLHCVCQHMQAWRWYFEHVGKGKCSIVDTWWQTETGGHLMTPMPGITPMKVGPSYLAHVILIDAQQLLRHEQCRTQA